MIIYMYIHTYIHTHARTHTYIHTHTHTYIHTLLSHPHLSVTMLIANWRMAIARKKYRNLRIASECHRTRLSHDVM